MNKPIEQKAINALRILGIDMINLANSGHPGIVLGAAPIVYTLFSKHININPKDSSWMNRDRFVLSAGHGSAMLYALNYLSGYKISLSDLKNFRKNGPTPGHPEYNLSKGVEATTGPLGQGLSMAVGMAIAETNMAANFNDEFKVFDNFTYVLCGDGDIQEGVVMEAMSLAGHLNLGKLIVLFDSNDIQLDGPTSLAVSDNHKKKFEAMGWQHILVNDGNEVNQISSAINRAKKEVNKPTIIEVKTTIGYGAPNAGTSKVHGSPIGEQGAIELRKQLNWNEGHFEVPEDVIKHYRTKVLNRGKKTYKIWKESMGLYQQRNKEKAALLKIYLNNDYSLDKTDIKEILDAEKISTRAASGKILNAFSKKYPNIIGGSADLTGSTMTKGFGSDYSPNNRNGRNIWYGVREHAMGAISNGITLYGGLKSFSGAFFVFSDYMKPSLRMASLMEIPSIFVFSHDSIAVGEDGPTHQPIEQLAGLRTIPNFDVIRPATGLETYVAWETALNSKHNPTALILTRQAVNNKIDASIEDIKKGGYVVSKENGKLDGVIVTCGSELELAINCQNVLREKGIFVRIVSIPSQFTFDAQRDSYKKMVIPPNAKIVAVEMGSPYSWYKYTHNVYGIHRFGLSDTADNVMKELKFTVEDFVEYYLSIK